MTTPARNTRAERRSRTPRVEPIETIETPPDWIPGTALPRPVAAEAAQPTKARRPRRPRAAAASTPEATERRSRATQARIEGNAPVRLHPDHSRYTEWTETRTASGRPAYDNADSVAAELRGLDLHDVYRIVAQATDQTIESLVERYEHLNPGMQRMNLGNQLRGARKAATETATKAA